MTAAMVHSPEVRIRIQNTQTLYMYNYIETSPMISIYETSIHKLTYSVLGLHLFGV